MKKWSVYLLLFLAGFSHYFLACDKDETPEGTVLEITDCVNQDGNSLPVPVKIVIDDQIQTWQPKENTWFLFDLQEPSKEVAITAQAGGDYILDLLKTPVIQKDEKTEIELTFYQPYLIKIYTRDAQDNPVRYLNIQMNDIQIGRTDQQGELVWNVTVPQIRAGTDLTASIDHPDWTFHPDSKQSILIKKDLYTYSLILRLVKPGEPLVSLPDSVKSDTVLVEPTIPEPEITQQEQEKEPSIKFTLNIQAKTAEKGLPLPGVTVKLDGRSIGTTNSKGDLRYSSDKFTHNKRSQLSVEKKILSARILFSEPHSAL